MPTDDPTDSPADLAALRAIMDGSPVVVYAKDRDLRFVLSNTKHRQLLQRPISEIIGRTDGELLGGEATEVDAVSARVLETGVPSIEEFSLPLPEGERVFHETIFRLQDARSQTIGVGGIATDITRRIELEAEVRSQNARLEEALAELQQTRAVAQEAERMASLGRLVAGLGHEVNTPLSVAALSLTVIAEAAAHLSHALPAALSSQTPVSQALDQVYSSVELAQEQVQRITSLMHSFREVAVDRVHVEARTLSLGEWMHLTHQTLQPVCRQHSVQLTTELDHDSTFRLPVGILHQVATNLVVNACRHAFDSYTQVRRVALSLRFDDDHLHLDVQDNGKGVSPSIRPHLFEPFFTTTRGNGGTGLGLHIVYNMVVGTLGGTIECTTPREGGARFHVALPFSPEALHPMHKVAARVELGIDLPLSLWAAFASDLHTRATQLQRCTSDAARAAIYAQLVGSLGVYGLTDLSEVIRRGTDAPDPVAQAFRVAQLLKAHARSIEGQLCAEAPVSDAPSPHHGHASGT